MKNHIVSTTVGLLVGAVGVGVIALAADGAGQDVPCKEWRDAVRQELRAELRFQQLMNIRPPKLSDLEKNAPSQFLQSEFATLHRELRDIRSLIETQPV